MDEDRVRGNDKEGKRNEMWGGIGRQTNNNETKKKEQTSAAEESRNK